MEEILKTLAPWPLAQGIIIGFLIAAGGIWAMRRGLQDNNKHSDADGDGSRTVRIKQVVAVRVEHTDEEKRWQWEAYKQLGHLETNSFEMAKHAEDSVDLLREILKGINRLADTRFNSRQ
ncbi:hypothetical protein JQ594_15640 [Bradyrhizobium manausense]|uniref:hypothetical protein n=1 Tax=Bradyrhizobium manausense TaxID=989370 RepID=UPI001BA91935|nr:hypothetical protein [Bradyrhizobium manausense]MBR0687364.1 hypothetical protein [Bradyrhizobium manausense]